MRQLATFIAAAAIMLMAVGTGPVSAQANNTHTISIASGVGTEYLNGSTWQPANVICQHVAWAPPLAGSSYVGFPAADCYTDVGFVYGTFRNTFTLPTGYLNASINVQWYADNAAQVRLNGTSIGGNFDDCTPLGGTSCNTGYFGYNGAPAATASSADPVLFHAGTNELALDLHNWGGPSGLDYVATVTYTLPLLPTTKDQCKGGGWQSFAVFANQGDCVSFVATKGKNAPGN